jgi:hypothetical protein
LLMVESSMYACALPFILSDQIVWLVEHKHMLDSAINNDYRYIDTNSNYRLLYWYKERKRKQIGIMEMKYPEYHR